VDVLQTFDIGAGSRAEGEFERITARVIAPNSDRSNPEVQHNRVMVARAVAGLAVHDLASDDVDRIIGQDMVDADTRILVKIDEVGRHGEATSGRWDRIPEAELTEPGKDLLAAFDEPIHGRFRVAGEVAERRDELAAIDAILRTDAIEITTNDERPSQTGDQLSEVEGLVFRVAMRVGMIRRDGELACRGVDDCSEPTTIIDAQFLET